MHGVGFQLKTRCLFSHLENTIGGWFQCGCATPLSFLTHSHLPVQFIQSKAHGKSHSRVSSLCSEVHSALGQKTRSRNPTEKCLCLLVFDPLHVLLAMALFCQSLVWSSSADTHVASIYVVSVWVIKQDKIKSHVVLLLVWKETQLKCRNKINKENGIVVNQNVLIVMLKNAHHAANCAKKKTRKREETLVKIEGAANV